MIRTVDSQGVIVLGMHRSGTSAVAGTLDHHGYRVVGEPLPPWPDNPLGYWEPKEVVEIHDDFLSSIGRVWSDPSPLPPGVFASEHAEVARTRLRGYVTRLAESERWVLKDPRLCRLMPLWLPLLRNSGAHCRYLFVARAPLSVAASLAVRDGMPRNVAVALWLRHYIEAESATRGEERRWTLFGEWLSGAPDLLERIASWLQEKDVQGLMESQRSIVSPALAHHDDEILAAGSVGEDSTADSVWTAIRALGRGGDDSRCLDGVASGTARKGTASPGPAVLRSRPRSDDRGAQVPSKTLFASSPIPVSMSSRPLKVLFVAHGHPDIHVGGAEVFAYELFRGVRRMGGVEAVFVARTFDSGHAGRSGTPFRGYRDRRDEVLWYPGAYDHFYQMLVDKKEYTVSFRELLSELRPDVVHVQHTSGIGLGILREIRRVVPEAAILYTLHEFLPICNASGLMVRTGSGDLCDRAEPTRCHRCFPSIDPSSFFLRERVAKTELEHVDRFIAPSHFLRRRFVEWGIPEERIVFEDYGRLPLVPLADPAGGPPIGNFAFLGQLAPHKGLLVLLEAMRVLREEGSKGLRLFIHGSNVESQAQSFQDRFHELSRACAESVVLAGPYGTNDLPERLRDVAWVVVPSIWWENSPLVIQEANLLRRPVICSDIGGMAEKVRDGIDGLRFRPGDPAHLASVLRRAATAPELWRSLQAGIRPVHTIEATVKFHLDLYQDIRAKRRAALVERTT